MALRVLKEREIHEARSAPYLPVGFLSRGELSGNIAWHVQALLSQIVRLADYAATSHQDPTQARRIVAEIRKTAQQGVELLKAKIRPRLDVS
jgi:hypothetical protein